MTALPSIDINAVRRELCKREGGFEFYIKYIQEYYYGYKPNLYDYQMQIVDFLNDVMAGKTTRGIINLPPRYRKTEIAVKMFISYCIGMNPKSRFIHLSYSDDLALDNSEAIKDIIQSDCFQALFPVKLKADSKSKKKWYTDQGGGVYATSSGGQVTGFGAGKSIEDYGLSEYEEVLDVNEFMKGFTPDTFGGAIVLDDANKPEDAFSPLTLSRVNNRFDSTIKNRVNSRYTPIINIQQRIAKNDLSGYLIKESDDWRLLRLQALSDDLTPLCEQIHTKDELLKLRKENESIFNTQYQQDPKPSEGLMYEPFTYVDKLPEDRNNIIRFTTTDVADAGNDYFATWFWEINGGHVYIYDAIYTQEPSGLTSKKFQLKTELHDCYINKIESNNQGGTYATLLQTMGVRTDGYYSTGNKVHRITSNAMFSKYVRFLKPGSQTYHTDEYQKALIHMEGFPKDGKHEDTHDDCEDSFTEGLRYIWANYRSIFSE